MKKILSCIALLTIYASMHSSNQPQSTNDVREITLWYKKMFAQQCCRIALNKKRPDIAARVGSYVHSKTTWRSEIEKDSYYRPTAIGIENSYEFQVMQEMDHQFPDLKKWFKEHAN